MQQISSSEKSVNYTQFLSIKITEIPILRNLSVASYKSEGGKDQTSLNEGRAEIKRKEGM